jgi:CheY-like chemotaxis protein
VISNSTPLLSQLRWGGFRRVSLDLRVTTTASEVLAMVDERLPHAVVLESALADGDAFTLCAELRQRHRAAQLPLVVVHQGSISREIWPQVTASGCDELLTMPLGQGQLYEVLAPHLGLKQRRHLRVVLRAGATAKDASIELTGELYDLSVTGARIRLPVLYSGGPDLTVVIERNTGQRMEVRARLVWQRPYSNGAEMAVDFTAPDRRTAALLAGWTTWQLEWRKDHQLAVIQRDLTELADFGGLAETLSGPVVFDMKKVELINSMGVSIWVRFLREIPDEVEYSFERCSAAFCTQVAYLQEMRGRGTIESFHAPYHCSQCYAEEAPELRACAIDLDDPRPPVLRCATCGGELVFDEVPERFFLFLKGGRASSSDR